MKTIGITAIIVLGLACPVWAETAEQSSAYLTPQQREELRKTARQTAQEMAKLMSDFKAIYGELKTAMEEEGLTNLDGQFAGGGEAMGKADVIDDKKHMIVQMDMPGVTKDEIRIQLKDSTMLEIEAERKESRFSRSNDGSADVVQAERQQGIFKRAIKLPYKAANKGIDAKLENGVLTLRIPKDMKEIQKQVRDIQVS